MENQPLGGGDNRVEMRIDYYRESYGEYLAEEYIKSDSTLLADDSTGAVFVDEVQFKLIPN